MTRRAPKSAVARQDAPPRLPPHGCQGCGNRWSGANTCHCSACHTTFGGLAAFDLHHFKDRCRTVREMREFGYVTMPRNGWSAISKLGDDE